MIHYIPNRPSERKKKIKLYFLKKKTKKKKKHANVVLIFFTINWVLIELKTSSKLERVDDVFSINKTILFLFFMILMWEGDTPERYIP